MLDFLFTLGQAAAAMLVLYGAMLVIGTLQSKSRKLAAAQEDALLLLKHIQNDA